jgi:hypothetical protein
VALRLRIPRLVPLHDPALERAQAALRLIQHDPAVDRELVFSYVLWPTQAVEEAAPAWGKNITA